MPTTPAHPNPPPLPDITPDQLDQVIQDYHDAGATTVTTVKQSDGNYQITARFDDPAPAPDPATAAGSSTPDPVIADDPTPIAFIDYLIGCEFQTNVDGAPNAYGPPNIGPTLDYELDAHVHAKSTGTVVGYIVQPDGSKPTQTSDDPYPGYYISTTSFQDVTVENLLNPRRYVDAARIHYVVRGLVATEHGVRLGDFVAVHSISNAKSTFGIVGDSGNSTGAEGSLALLQALGYAIKSGKSGSVNAKDIIVRYFPKSNPRGDFFAAQADLEAAALQLGLSKDFSAHV